MESTSIDYEVVLRWCGGAIDGEDFSLGRVTVPVTFDPDTDRITGFDVSILHAFFDEVAKRMVEPQQP